VYSGYCPTDHREQQYIKDCEIAQEMKKFHNRVVIIPACVPGRQNRIACVGILVKLQVVALICETKFRQINRFPFLRTLHDLRLSSYRHARSKRARVPPGVYRVGDKVRWTKASWSSQLKQNSTGVILRVIPTDCGVEHFNLYDVEFDFGMYMLYGTQLDPEPKELYIVP